jgi:hypothetical protein
MARQVIVTLTDDFDGKSDADETVQFSLDGVGYEIDLSVLNAAKLRGELEPWMKKARKLARTGKTKNTRGSRSAARREQTVMIREWARRNGHNVSSRGRIAAEVIDAYQKSVAS